MLAENLVRYGEISASSGDNPDRLGNGKMSSVRLGHYHLGDIYYSTQSANQWWNVDLGSLCNITLIHVFGHELTGWCKHHHSICPLCILLKVRSHLSSLL